MVLSAGGDSSDIPAQNVPLAETANLSAATVTLSATLAGGLVLLNATITSSDGNPTGTVTFKEGNTTLGWARISPQTGIATYPVLLGRLADPFIGVHSFVSDYSGNSAFASATSQPSTLSIEKDLGSVSFSIEPMGPTFSGQPVTLVAAVSTNRLRPTGTVTFLDGNTPLMTMPIDRDGCARFKSNTLTEGTHMISVAYSGSDKIQSAESRPYPVAILPAAKTSLQLSASAISISYAQPITLTATLSPWRTLGVFAEGSVTFREGSTVLGTAKLVNCTATLELPSLPVGRHIITASYSGAVGFAATQSQKIKLWVTRATVVDWAAVYTPPACKSAGSATAMLHLIKGAVQEVNQILANSKIPLTIRLVYAGQVNYADSGQFALDLTRLAGVHDGYMDSVHSLRDRYGADLVTLFVAGGDVEGLSYVLTSTKDRTNPSRGFSVVRASSSPGYVLAHELGHNFGAAHDRAHVDVPGLFPYSNGYTFRVYDAVYHDVMSYGPGEAIPYYANPNIIYSGVRIGNAKSADVAKTILQTSSLVAAYRKTAVPIGAPAGGTVA